MKVIQTLSTENSNRMIHEYFGWLSPEFHLMAWALSCFSIQKIGYSPFLYTDDAGARFLIDKLSLPYRKVEISQIHFYLPYKHLWALSKIHTYSLQTEPFIHIDGDVFLFQAFNEKFLNSPLVVQNIEVATDYYTSAQQQYMNFFTYFPDCVRKDFWSGKPIKAVNAGLLGGNNLEFIQKYAYEAKQYVKRNESVLHKANSDRFNVFFEQHLFYAMAKQEGLKVETYLKQQFPDNQYTGLANFHEVPAKRKYLHMLGHFKRDEFCCLQMAAMLRQQYPETYEKVLRLFKKDKLHPSLHYEKTLLQNGVSFSCINLKQVSEQFNQTLTFLQKQKRTKAKTVKLPHDKITEEYLTEIILSSPISSETKDDLQMHKESVKKIQQSFNQIPENILYQRNLDAVEWYKDIFLTGKKFSNIRLTKAANIQVIESVFDWGGIIRSMRCEGRPYYDQIRLEKGTFFTLCVPELNQYGMVVWDIEEMENMILEILTNDIDQSFQELFSRLLDFTDDEVRQNHQYIFKKLVLASLEQLVLKKAVKPVRVL
jgi:hypothetical protein